MKSLHEQLEILKRGATELISEEELGKKLQKGKPLIVKAGFDPTAPDLHLGHTVLINKLKQFQDLGHEVNFLIGDFTAKIGDPSGRSSTRPPLTGEQIKANTKTYCDQVFKILDRKKTKVHYNSTWLGKLGAEGMIDLASRFTVARMLERDDFKTRFKEGSDISILEFYYPLLQGYDSVIMRADVELGGIDQKFNLLMGRTLQRRYEQEQQVILMMPLLVGTDGVKKMSKSFGNHIAIQDAANEMFGKILSIGDVLMWHYFELLSFKAVGDVKRLRQEVEAGRLNPKLAKVELAKEIVARFHSEQAALAAADQFDKVFAHKGLPDEIEECKIKLGKEPLGLLDIMTKAGLTQSNGEARRLIEQGGVQISQKKVTDTRLSFDAKQDFIIQVGKRRFKRVILS